MSSQAEEKKCCVCGAPSTMRCSACAQAGVDLYFCSAEHQKLVWFAHKPVCGPLKADFAVLPDFTPAETRILQSPAFLQTFAQRRIPGSSSAQVGEALALFEIVSNVAPGSTVRNAPRMQEWLRSLADPVLRSGLRLYVNSALSDFLYSADGSANDPLEMPAHDFAFDCWVWHTSTQKPVPRPRIQHFLHGAIIWAGLLRIVAGRVTVAGVNTSCVTPEFVAANLERLLQSIQADLDLTIGDTGSGLIPLVSQPLSAVPAMSRFNLEISTVAGNPASNKISVVLREAPRSPSASREL